MCRVGFVETVRAVGLSGGAAAARSVRREWPAIAVVEIDQRLVEHAAGLAAAHGLGSLGAVHLAAALVLPGADQFATWDSRLHAAAGAEGLDLVPATLD